MPEESSSLTQSYQRSLVELNLAYDATVEAFSHALELREGEPFGHTHQVTEVTINLCKAMGVSLPEQPHIRRGALLHDIGKLGIPEALLRKTSEFTREEWAVIRLHPQIAYDLLFPIIFLHPAIDIPYCHHEKWDGSGYPQGLKAEKIPLSARIFAVVDVWDALTSERPQRRAWREAQAMNYLIDQAGRHFDPSVVDMFLKGHIRKKVTRPLV
jgi:HD-GYP domain-containing protein (c-di-GMP phosphodiesterase class II)